jgi:hypothetical protein
MRYGDAPCSGPQSGASPPADGIGPSRSVHDLSSGANPGDAELAEIMQVMADNDPAALA